MRQPSLRKTNLVHFYCSWLHFIIFLLGKIKLSLSGLIQDFVITMRTDFTEESNYLPVVLADFVGQLDTS